MVSPTSQGRQGLPPHLLKLGLSVKWDVLIMSYLTRSVIAQCPTAADICVLLHTCPVGVFLSFFFKFVSPEHRWSQFVLTSAEQGLNTKFLQVKFCP